ncbi:MAG: YdeI/OmpD-associated family protein [Acidobacteriota bacterium]
MAWEESFTATIKIAGINPYVDVPKRVMETLGGGAKVAVLVKLAVAGDPEQSGRVPRGRRVVRDAARLRAIGRLASGGWFRSTLVGLRSEAPRLYLDIWMRDTAGVGVGEHVRVTLRPDRSSRELPVPALLRQVLESSEEAKQAWEHLTPSRRREILTYLNFLKTPAALERNVKKMIASLIAGSGQRD